MSSLDRFVIAAGVAFSIALVAGGCAPERNAPTQPRVGDSHSSSSTTTQPLRESPSGPRGWSDFFPLDSGSVWTFAGENRLIFRPNSGGPDIVEDDVRVAIIVRMLGTRVLDGVPYAVWRRETHADGMSPSRDFLFRQDDEGLFVVYPTPEGRTGPGSGSPASSALPDRVVGLTARIADPVVRTAVTRALAAIRARTAEGAVRRAAAREPLTLAGVESAPDEFRWLRYPIHAGQQWVEDARGEDTGLVEGRDVLRVGGRSLPCWRIRVASRSDRPNDRWRHWYGTQGYLGTHNHFEEPAIDPSRGVIGLTVVEVSETLTDFTVVRSARRPAIRIDR